MSKPALTTIENAELGAVTAGFARGWYAWAQGSRGGHFVQNPTRGDYQFYGRRLSPQLDMFGPHLKGNQGF